jgi:Ca2+-binding EF-hand superfamily protein
VAAIRALGFNVSNDEFDLLFNEFDLDGSGSVSYREFLRKMRRSGVFTRNNEDEALFRLFKAIKQAGITVRKAFQMIDFDGSNEVSKAELESTFRKLGIDITTQTADYIFKMCDDDMSGSISCAEFEKLFDNIIRESIIEDKEIFPAELDWKLEFVLKMEEISEKYHQGGLKQTFMSLDGDGNQSITITELTEFFKKASI